MKVITVSRFFPANHPRKGEDTFFIEKIKNSISVNTGGGLFSKHGQKHHTIRKGTRWKKGEMACLRYWSGRPYITPQTEFLQVELVDVKTIAITKDENGFYISIDGCNWVPFQYTLNLLAQNDGLSLEDLKAWFKLDSKRFTQFTGQIICWKVVNEY